MHLERYTLDNGLRVVLDEDHAAPLVAINLWYHVGSKNERPGRTGFAHLFEHMLFSGSQHVGNNEHFRHVQSVGGTLNGSTTFDRTNYYETLPSHHLELGLWLESDRQGFFLPAITQEKFDIQREVVKEERRLRYENAPYGLALEQLLGLAYDPDYPYHWPTIGSMADLEAATLEDVTSFFRTWYVPNNAVLTLTGDFDQSEARRLIDRYFAEIPRAADPPRFEIERLPLQGERRGESHSSVQFPRVYRLYHLPPFGASEWIAGDLLSYVLSSGRASRLERALVYEKRIAQDVGSFLLQTEATGMMIFVATAKENVDPALLEEAMDEEIQELIHGGIREEELTRARNQAETGYARELESFASRADLLSTFETFHGDASRVHAFVERYRDVSSEQLRSLAERCLRAENRATLRVMPQPGLATVGVVAQ
ncbi:MAG TPA: pitrilysin family protein [Thermoanaerobaculia bacterium]|nr:pitrilysin family protein [Thermoanaerobaculia bacterium]